MDTDDTIGGQMAGETLVRPVPPLVAELAWIAEELVFIAQQPQQVRAIGNYTAAGQRLKLVRDQIMSTRRGSPAAKFVAQAHDDLRRAWACDHAAKDCGHLKDARDFLGKTIAALEVAP